MSAGWPWPPPGRFHQTETRCRIDRLRLNHIHNLRLSGTCDADPFTIHHVCTAAETHKHCLWCCCCCWWWCFHSSFQMLLLCSPVFINKPCLCVGERNRAWFVFRSPSWTPRHYSPLSHFGDLMILANWAVFLLSLSHTHTHTHKHADTPTHRICVLERKPRVHSLFRTEPRLRLAWQKRPNISGTPFYDFVGVILNEGTFFKLIFIIIIIRPSKILSSVWNWNVRWLHKEISRWLIPTELYSWETNTCSLAH